jgi:NAD(P)-dependent dehydrogenase (short-subunit alcohol dehydrogenase family)
MLLDGKVAVISGAASPRGIGLATARLFAEHGAHVAILDLDAGHAEAAAASIGTTHLGVACDVTDHAACSRAVAAVEGAMGPIDILINNAGITQPLKFMEIGAAQWDAVMDVNLRGVLNLSQATVPGMRARGHGSIACMSSVSAQRGGGIFGGPHYSAAKAGVLGLAKAMARELGPR